MCLWYVVLSSCEIPKSKKRSIVTQMFYIGVFLVFMLLFLCLNFIFWKTLLNVRFTRYFGAYPFSIHTLPTEQLVFPRKFIHFRHKDYAVWFEAKSKFICCFIFSVQKASLHPLKLSCYFHFYDPKLFN